MLQRSSRGFIPLPAPHRKRHAVSGDSPSVSGQELCATILLPMSHSLQTQLRNVPASTTDGPCNGSTSSTASNRTTRDRSYGQCPFIAWNGKQYPDLCGHPVHTDPAGIRASYGIMERPGKRCCLHHGTVLQAPDEGQGSGLPYRPGKRCRQAQPVSWLTASLVFAVRKTSSPPVRYLCPIAAAPCGQSSGSRVRRLADTPTGYSTIVPPGIRIPPDGPHRPAPDPGPHDPP